MFDANLMIAFDSLSCSSTSDVGDTINLQAKMDFYMRFAWRNCRIKFLLLNLMQKCYIVFYFFFSLFVLRGLKRRAFVLINFKRQSSDLFLLFGFLRARESAANRFIYFWNLESEKLRLLLQSVFPEI